MTKELTLRKNADAQDIKIAYSKSISCFDERQKILVFTVQERSEKYFFFSCNFLFQLIEYDNYI